VVIGRFLRSGTGLTVVDVHDDVRLSGLRSTPAMPAALGTLLKVAPLVRRRHSHGGEDAAAKARSAATGLRSP
jgi:hypothetical protein